MEEKEKNENTQPESVTVETTTVTEGAPAEKTARDLFNDSVREFAPDGKYDEDENEYFAKGNEMIAALKEKGKKWDDMSDKLLKRFQADPSDAAAFLDFADGMPLVAAIVKNKGREALAEPAEGEEGWDEFVKGLDENRKHRSDMDAAIAEIKKNAEESEARLKKLAEENGWSEEEAKVFWDHIYGDMEAISKGRVDDDFIKKAMRSYNYERDMAAAMEQGKADGRNEKIDAERKRMKGSGLPNAGGGANASEEVGETSGNSTADWLSNFKHR